MLSFFSRYYESSFRYGMKIGDPLWFIERCITQGTENGYCFSLLYFVLVSLLIEIGSETYSMFRYKPSIDTILRLGPGYFNLLHCLLCIIPFLKQRYQYRKLIRSIRHDFISLNNIDASCYAEIRKIYKNVIVITILICLLALYGVTFQLPWLGIHYETSIWPETQFLSIVRDPPRLLEITLLFVNYASMYPKVFFMAIYGIHVMHLCQLYRIQHLLLKSRLKQIRYHGRIDDLYLNDRESYQKWVRMELVKCIKLHIRLKKFGDSVANYFKVTVLFHTANVVLLLTMVSYILAFNRVQGNIAYSFQMELVLGGILVFLYTHFGEVFAAQIGEIRAAFYALPWYTFDIKTRKIMLIYSHVLNEEQWIGLVIFNLNYAHALWIIHKVVNYLTMLAKLSEKS